MSTARGLSCSAIAAFLLAYGVALYVNPLLNLVYFVVVCLFTMAVSGVVAVLVTQLREQAVTNGLTGVLNRRGPLVMSSYVYADLMRRRGPMSVVLIDIDPSRSTTISMGTWPATHYSKTWRRNSPTDCAAET